MLGTIDVHRVARVAALAVLIAGATSAAAWPLLASRTRPPPLTAVAAKRVHDVDDIVEAGVLRVAMFPDEVGYERRRGREGGFALELSGWVSRQLGVELRVVAPLNPAQALRLVASGEADLAAFPDPGPIAPGVAVAWSGALDRVRPTVVGRKAAALAGVEDLRGSRVAVRRHTALEAVANSWAAAPGAGLEVVSQPPQWTDGQLAAGAARIDWDFALLDERRAWLEAGARGPLEVSPPLGEPLPVRWAMRADAPDLASAFDELIREARRRGYLAELERRYLENPLRLKAARRPGFRTFGPALSPWDPLFRRIASEHDLDWRLLAAIAFTESGYDPWEISPVGAMGLLQLMPRIVAHYEVQDPFDPEQNVDAGARLLGWLEAHYSGIPEPERIAFALAAYHIGLGHVEDARGLAARRGLDPHRWAEHVARVLPLLEDDAVASTLPHGMAHGGSTVRYVSKVLGLYGRFSRQGAPAAREPTVPSESPVPSGGR
jgi:membrane-bound lytic murein transglycosylase F